MPNIAVKSIKTLEVVVGIIDKIDPLTKKPQYLLAQRPKGKMLADKWEFPGGKIEPLESELSALRREFFEELNIHIATQSCQKIWQTHWHYDTFNVNLHFYHIKHYLGQIQAKEKQNIDWFNIDEIDKLLIPPANKGLVDFLKMPEHIAITPDTDDPNVFMKNFKQLIQQNIQCIQIRLQQKQWLDWGKQLSSKITELAKNSQIKILLNSKICGNIFNPKLLPKNFSGWHLSSKHLLQLQKPFNNNKIYSTSVHNLKELNQAERLNLDFSLLSPILKTKTHPNKKALGWQKAQEVRQQATIPIYYLGGMNALHLQQVQNNLAKGIAGIRLYQHKYEN